MAITQAVLDAIIQDRGTAFVDPRLKSSIAKLVAFDQAACLQNPTTLACESILYSKRQINATVNFELDCQIRQYGTLSMSGIFYPGVTQEEVETLVEELTSRLVEGLPE